MEKLFIKNRKGQKIAVMVEQPQTDPKDMAFVMHGLGSSKESPQIETIASAFRDNGFIVVRFDATNAMGESDGNYENATFTNYYEDLEDVIKWAETQNWYKEPFWVAGSSLGGYCVAYYAENYPEKVKALAPKATVVSGSLIMETLSKESLEQWERLGYRLEESIQKPGFIKKLNWNPHVPDRLKHDLRPNVHKLTMPVLMVVGDRDTTTPLEHQNLMFNLLPGPKQLHVVKGAAHSFIEPEHLKELKEIFDKWIKSL